MESSDTSYLLILEKLDEMALRLEAQEEKLTQLDAKGTTSKSSQPLDEPVARGAIDPQFNRFASPKRLYVNFLGCLCTRSNLRGASGCVSGAFTSSEVSASTFSEGNTVSNVEDPQ